MRIPVPSTTQTPPPAAAGLVFPAWWPWGVGALLGLVVLGPGLSGGSLLSLDLLVTPDIPIPNGVFGLGPGLSQRVPLFALLGVGSALVGGPVTVKVFLVVCTAAGFAGAARLARLLAPAGLPAGALTQLAAGLLWAGGPFALTRIGVGHINLLWVVAVLPWALPRLCRPADHLPSTFLASLAMAIGGPGGGTLGLAVAVVALVTQPAPRRWLRPAGAIVAPHAVWIGPTAVLLWAGAGVTGAGGFATVIDGVGGWPALVAGNGFWRWDYQVGAVGTLGAVAGVAIGVLAAHTGVRLVRHRGVSSWSGIATVVGALGLLLAAASAVPGIRGVYGWLSELPFGAPLRESHRFLALWLVWAAPAAAVGGADLAQALRRRAGADAGAGAEAGRTSGAGAAARVGATVLAALPLAVALLISVPGWWGLDGRLEPVEYPPGWAQARAVIDNQPGTVVAFPWSEYPPLSFAGGRQVFNPVPEYLGGDVISSYDPVFDPDRPSQEQVDARAVVVDRLSDAVRAGRLISDELARLGVRWVVLIDESAPEEYAALDADPGLMHALDGPDVDLYAVLGWQGQATGPDGAGWDVARPVPFVLTTDAPAGSVLHVSGAPGWVQGWGSPAQVTADGELRITGSAGVVWFWPTPVLLLTDGILLGAAIVAMRSRSRRFGRILA